MAFMGACDTKFEGNDLGVSYSGVLDGFLLGGTPVCCFRTVR